ncbi:MULTISPECIES: holin [unclassified Streptomyces]|uniref:holin n=1 Tax=unclassified Streptomyces TaxID=2593676 RepID=UPI0034475A1B
MAPVETKVTAATAGTYIASTGILAGLAALQDDARLLEWLPDGVTPFVVALIPAAISFMAGYRAKHTPRTGILR